EGIRFGGPFGKGIPTRNFVRLGQVLPLAPDDRELKRARDDLAGLPRRQQIEWRQECQGGRLTFIGAAGLAASIDLACRGEGKANREGKEIPTRPEPGGAILNQAVEISPLRAPPAAAGRRCW